MKYSLNKKTNGFICYGLNYTKMLITKVPEPLKALELFQYTWILDAY